MFGISFSEIILIFMISLVIFGPREIPQIATKAGKLIYTIKSYFYNLKQDIYEKSGFNEINNTKNDIVNSYNLIKNNIKIHSHSSMPISDELGFTFMEEDIFYQPELEFDRQPELFD